MRDKFFFALAAVWLALALAGCGINVEKDEKGKEKKVDIETPIGGLHVRKQIDPKETGLPVYPGARPKQESEHESSSANVSIASSMFGLKVAAAAFETDDPPEKVLDFYRKELKSFGTVLECHDQHSGVKTSRHGDESKELTCDDGSGGVRIGMEKHGVQWDDARATQLKVGTTDNQHVVEIKRRGNLTEFSLIYVRTRGGETI